MKDPQRLILGDATEFERMLLESGADERIPPEVSARMAAALSLPFATQLTVPPPPPPVVAGAASGSTSSVGTLLLTLGVGTLVVGGAVGGVWWRGHSNVEGADTRTTASAPADAAQALAPRRATPTSVPEPRGPLGASASDVSPTAPSPDSLSFPSSGADDPAPRKSSTADARNGVKRRSAGDIAAELRLLDSARTAIAQGDQQEATRLLTRYDAEFPHGELRREAGVLWSAARANPAAPSRAGQR